MNIKSIKKRQPRVRSRNYCFTDWKLQDWPTFYNNNKAIVRYLVKGEEIGKESGKKHYQCWIQFFNPKDFNVIRKMLKITGKGKLFKMKGTEFQNEEYCKKDNKWKSFGKFVSQGYRSDLEDIKNSIDTHQPMKDIWDSHFGTMIRYHSGVQKYREILLRQETKKFRKLNVEFRHGKTDTKKTRSAVEKYPNHFKIEGPNLRWFDGYEGEETLIIDEYSNDIPITKLMGLLDGYQLRLPIKNGFTYANWKKVIITSNLKKEELHPNAKPEHRRALFRRIHKFVHYMGLAQSD